MTVAEVLSRVSIINGKILSNDTGKEYTKHEFIEQISSKLKWTKKQKQELENYLADTIKAQTEDSKYIESLIEKYNIKFSDGVYIINENVMTMDEIYRLLWKEEKLLPTSVDTAIENIEKISEPMNLQNDIFRNIVNSCRRFNGKSKYLKSLYDIYPDIQWKEIMFNILVPNTKPLFHIFYDDGVGGTGKSTLLEVLTKIVGENFTSNVLLDQFGNRFIFANMLGKYLNVGDDNGKNDELQNVGTLKSIITGNRVTIDRKNIAPIEVRIFAKQLFATNILPYIDFTDGGIMRRLNIVPMNKVIPKDMELCEFNEEELGNIVNEVLLSSDLVKNESELAITSSPLYRFFSTQSNTNYDNYKSFCEENGFKKLNVINFEVKSKFVRSFIKEKEKTKKQLTINELEEVEQSDELPF